MSHRGMCAVIGGAALAALLLTGCTAEARPTLTPTPTTSDAPGPSVSALAPTPTPTAAQNNGAEPRVRVPLSCAHLFTLDEVSDSVGTTVPATLDETSHPRSVEEVAERQYGVLHCLWGKGPGESALGRGISLYIAPDAASKYVVDRSGARPVRDTAGDRSSYGCSPGGFATCSGSMAVSGYLVTVAWDDGGKLAPADQKRAMQKVLDVVATAVRGARAPLPPWTGAASSAPSFCMDPRSTSKVQASFDSSALARGGTPASLRPNGYSSVAVLDRRYSTCTWLATRAFVDVTLVAAGSWASEVIRPVPLIESSDVLSPVTISGASRAFIGCAEDVCDDAYLFVGTTAVHLTTLGESRARLVQQLGALSPSLH